MTPLRVRPELLVKGAPCTLQDPTINVGPQAWSLRRSTLMHDWLSAKHFLGKLSGLHKVLQGEVERPGFSLGEIRAAVAEWRGGRADIVWLIDTFPLNMSPARALLAPPLAALPEGDRIAMARIVHELWLRRVGAERLPLRARRLLRLVDRRADELEKALGEPGAWPERSPFDPAIVAGTAALLAAVRGLQLCLASYPAHVRAT